MRWFPLLVGGVSAGLVNKCEKSIYEIYGTDSLPKIDGSDADRANHVVFGLGHKSEIFETVTEDYVSFKDRNGKVLVVSFSIDNDGPSFINRWCY